MFDDSTCVLANAVLRQFGQGLEAAFCAKHSETGEKCIVDLVVYWKDNAGWVTPAHTFKQQLIPITGVLWTGVVIGGEEETVQVYVDNMQETRVSYTVRFYDGTQILFLPDLSVEVDQPEKIPLEQFMELLQKEKLLRAQGAALCQPS